jgi:hypothetical protein
MAFYRDCGQSGVTLNRPARQGNSIYFTNETSPQKRYNVRAYPLIGKSADFAPFLHFSKSSI